VGNQAGNKRKTSIIKLQFLGLISMQEDAVSYKQIRKPYFTVFGLSGYPKHTLY